MGIIKRQGLKSTIVNYFGALIGAIAVLWIYPLNDEIYGYALWLYSTAYLLVPLATGGLLSLTVKYFPSYSKKDPKNYHGLLTLLLTGLIGFYLLFLSLWFLFRTKFIAFLELLKVPKTEIIEENQFYLLALLGLLILLRFLVAHASNGLRIVIPDLIEKLGYKIYLPLLVLAYVYQELSVQTFAKALLVFFALAVILMLVYLKYLGLLNFGKISKPEQGESYKEMGKYAAFGSLNQLGNTLAVRLDGIMIPLFLGMVKNGFYGKALFISNVLDYPTRALTQIASPIISKAWAEDNLTEIGTIYKKASANLFLIGALVFLILWFTLDDIIGLSVDPSTFPDARMIFLVLAIGKMMDMLTSVNSHILIYSKDYKYNLWFLIVLGALNIYLNFKLIPVHGIVGAAVATTISLFAYNILKSLFIYFRFGLHPFSGGILKTVILLGLFLGLYLIVPDSGMPFLNIIYKASLVGLTYLGLAYFWKVSEDANEMGLNILNRIFKFK